MLEGTEEILFVSPFISPDMSLCPPLLIYTPSEPQRLMGYMSEWCRLFLSKYNSAGDCLRPGSIDSRALGTAVR